MMIRKVVLRRFKRFADQTFDHLDGQVVLAGPNNAGKTTILQAIATWNLALTRWKELNDFQRHGGAYPKAPIARQAFSSVPLRAFDSLWHNRLYNGQIEIAITFTDGPTVTMELINDSTEQVYVRPKQDVDPAHLRALIVDVAFVPPMTGLSPEEPVYQEPFIRHLLGQGKPGDVLRNVLWQVSLKQTAWTALASGISRLFGFQLIPPNTQGAFIIAEYLPQGATRALDIASAGSGFQQVLMLLAFLYLRPSSVLLLDEPDAHLHVILQDAIYGELCAVAAKQNSQLLIATHSEVIINNVDPDRLLLVMNRPRRIADRADRNRLRRALGVLTNTDLMQAVVAPGVLFLEGSSDLALLRAWSEVLDHPARETLTTKLFWKQTIHQYRDGANGVATREMHDLLRLVKDDLPGLEITDSDGREEPNEEPITGQGMQRVRWRRYEIESYLIHPAALERFVISKVGEAASAPHVVDLKAKLEELFPAAVLANPLGEHAILIGTKARTLLLPPALEAAGIHGFDYTEYHEIAALMLPEEIHPEVTEKLDAIQQAFRL
jgi:ABC-type molybdenum transport system ATPase subunit/photorepair protein PhrA